ncbi:DUF1853 family protein [Marinomonas profundi]|nr:DUF1853 family protein [Marinomonas profundi]
MLSQLRHPLVKDLAWLVEGHYIERDFDLAPYWVADVNACLVALDDNPELLLQAFAACKSHFLGSYFETLFSFAIVHLSHLKMHREHFQIESKGKTLGEVDMLVETPDGQLHQFEIAIKFYLERPDLFPHDWIGPNKNDSLLKKVTRAREHQLGILQTEEGYAAIDALANGREVETNLLIFGRLYCALKNAADVRSWLAGEACGGWIRVSDLALLKADFSYFQLLDKPHWLAAPDINANFSFFSLQSAYNPVGLFLRDDRPKHAFFWQVTDQTKNVIQSRCVFIVADSW